MSMTWKPRSSLINELVLKRLTRDTKFVYLSTHVFKFPINTIIAWIINDYHEQGNIIITLLLLPLGHISNTYDISDSIAGVGITNLLITEGESSAELDGSSLPPLVVEG